MPLKPVDSYVSGGVDSRSNPINMPPDSYLLLENFWPQQDGSLRLRDGYVLFAEGVPDVSVYSIQPFTGPGPAYAPLVMFWQNMVPYVVDPSTGEMTSPSVLGTPIQSSARFCYFYTDGHLHAFNGTDAKWYDGYVWRDIGLPQPDLDSAANITIVESVNEFSATQAAAVTLTLAGGGSFPADAIGRYFYAAFYDKNAHEIGPATIALGPNDGFVQFALNNELQIAGLPSTASTNPSWVKLPALTPDGGDIANFVVTSTKVITAGTLGSAGTVTLTESSASTSGGVFSSPSFNVALSAANLNSGPATATVSGAEQTIPGSGAVYQNTTVTVTGVERSMEVPITGGSYKLVYDGGTLTIKITSNQGYNKSFQTGYAAPSTDATIATALASVINAPGLGGGGNVLKATASGSTVLITLGAGAGEATYTISVSMISTSPYFAGVSSFNLSFNNLNFGDLTVYDTGTVTVKVAGVAAVADYGAGDTPSTVAVKLAAAINSLPNPVATASSSGAVVTISSATTGVYTILTAAAHGFSVGDVIGLSNTGNAAYEGQIFTIVAVTTNTFTIFVPNALNAIQQGTAQKLLAIADSATSGTIAAPNFFTPYEVNLPRGIAASSVGGPQPGYQFYLSLYMMNAGGHVGNRVAIGPRIAPAVRTNVRILGAIPVTENEQYLLVGRTGDGAEVPYALIDDNGNWITEVGTFGDWLITSAQIDGNSELPYRNFPPPGTLDYNQQLANLAGGAAQNPPLPSTFSIAWVESDHCCGVIAGGPTIYRSGSALDMREGQFVGLPEQSWDPADIETFPTGEPITCGQGYQQESWVYTAEDCAVLVELAGELSWEGPWNIGACGQYAWTRGWKNLPFWISQEKQLVTVSLGGTTQVGGTYTADQAGPVAISDEYEAALLSQIGDAYLSQVELAYIRIPQKRVEVLRISCLDANGNPFTVIHDFNLRGGDAPYGKAYQEIFLGPLSAVYTQQFVRDGNNKGQIFCGGYDGNIYELYSGGNDDGTEFLAQSLKLVYLGPERYGANWLEWWGDGTVQFYVAKKLDTPFGTGQMVPLCSEEPMLVQGEADDNHWQVPIPEPEMVHCYLLTQLESHSADGNTNLNVPPHMPLETYGRIWLASPLIGDQREK
jgi:hypothetical protein